MAQRQFKEGGWVGAEGGVGLEAVGKEVTESLAYVGVVIGGCKSLSSFEHGGKDIVLLLPRQLSC